MSCLTGYASWQDLWTSPLLSLECYCLPVACWKWVSELHLDQICRTLRASKTLTYNSFKDVMPENVLGLIVVNPSPERFLQWRKWWVFWSKFTCCLGIWQRSGFHALVWKLKKKDLWSVWYSSVWQTGCCGWASQNSQQSSTMFWYTRRCSCPHKHTILNWEFAANTRSNLPTTSQGQMHVFIIFHSNRILTPLVATLYWWITSSNRHAQNKCIRSRRLHTGGAHSLTLASTWRWALAGTGGLQIKELHLVIEMCSSDVRGLNISKGRSSKLFPSSSLQMQISAFFLCWKIGFQLVWNGSSTTMRSAAQEKFV